CDSCHGLGTTVAMDENKVIPDTSLSLAEGAAVPWRSCFDDGELRENSWSGAILKAALEKHRIDPHKPWRKLTKKQQKILLYGHPAELEVEWEGDSTSGTWATAF